MGKSLTQESATIFYTGTLVMLRWECNWIFSHRTPPRYICDTFIIYDAFVTLMAFWGWTGQDRTG